MNESGMIVSKKEAMTGYFHGLGPQETVTGVSRDLK